MEEADRLDGITGLSPPEASQGQERAIQLLTLLSGLDQKLEAWSAEMQLVCAPPTLVTPSPDRHPAEEAREFAPTPLQYRRPQDCYLWIVYWTMFLFLHGLARQLKARQAILGAGQTPLPRDLARLGRDRETLDRCAEKVCGSLFSGLRNSPFAAQETMLGVFAVQLYYTWREKDGDGDNARPELEWCVSMMETIQAAGLNLGIRVVRREELSRGGGMVVLSRAMTDEE
jgi:hypothetical protein